MCTVAGWYGGATILIQERTQQKERLQTCLTSPPYSHDYQQLCGVAPPVCNRLLPFGLGKRVTRSERSHKEAKGGDPLSVPPLPSQTVR